MFYVEKAFSGYHFPVLVGYRKMAYDSHTIDTRKWSRKCFLKIKHWWEYQGMLRFSTSSCLIDSKDWTWFVLRSSTTLIFVSYRSPNITITREKNIWPFCKHKITSLAISGEDTMTVGTSPNLILGACIIGPYSFAMSLKVWWGSEAWAH